MHGSERGDDQQPRPCWRGEARRRCSQGRQSPDSADYKHRKSHTLPSAPPRARKKRARSAAAPLCSWGNRPPARRGRWARPDPATADVDLGSFFGDGSAVTNARRGPCTTHRPDARGGLAMIELSKVIVEALPAAYCNGVRGLVAGSRARAAQNWSRPGECCRSCGTGAYCSTTRVRWPDARRAPLTPRTWGLGRVWSAVCGARERSIARPEVVFVSSDSPAAGRGRAAGGLRACEACWRPTAPAGDGAYGRPAARDMRSCCCTWASCWAVCRPWPCVSLSSSTDQGLQAGGVLPRRRDLRGR